MVRCQQPGGTREPRSRSAAAAPAGEVLAAAQGDDSAVLADVLGLPIDDFADASLAALDAAPAGIDRLAVALITPEFMIA